MAQKKEEYVGRVLSESTTTEATCQLFETAERGGIEEGMLLLIKSGQREILARVAQIIPYNEYFKEGDLWSEARRKNLAIPDDVARRYEVCKLDLLSEIPKGYIKAPPQPGDLVIKIDPKIHQEKIFGVSTGEPGHVWFGSLIGYQNTPVPLNVEALPMHVAVFGVTGSGKSFTTGALIEKLAAIPVNKDYKVSYPMIILDAHGDYIDYVDYFIEKKELGQVGWIKRYVFPKVYMRPDMRSYGEHIMPIGINLDLIPLRELAEIIVLYHKGTTEGAELQIEAIANLIEEIKNKGYSTQSLLDPNLYFKDVLLEDLEKYADQEKMHPATKNAIIRALQSFTTLEEKYKLLSTESDLKKKQDDGSIEFVDKITREGGIAVFDFSADGAPGVDLKTKQFVVTYLATLLFDQFTNYKIKKEDRYLLFVIEEAQNFCPDKTYPIGFSLAHSKLSAIATQGRKFGLSLCLISQRPSFVDRIVLSMCNSFFIHRVSPEDVSFVRSVSGGLPQSLVPRLTNMNKGDLIVAGQITTVPFPLVIHVPDREVKHSIGKTNVCGSLASLRGIKLGENNQNI